MFHLVVDVVGYPGLVFSLRAKPLNANPQPDACVSRLALHELIHLVQVQMSDIPSVSKFENYYVTDVQFLMYM